MTDTPILIDELSELEPLGEAAATLGVALSLVDDAMTVRWRNRTCAEWFGELACGGGHCFAWHWGRSERCADCLPLLVFRSGEPREGLRVRGRPGEPRSAFRVTALPVQSRDGLRRWVLETMVPLHQLGRFGSTQPGFEQAVREVPSESSTAFLVVDTRGRIVSWSPSATAVFGYRLDEILGRKIDVLTPSDRTRETEQILSVVTSTGALPRLETVRLAKDGRMVPVALSAAALRDEAGELIGYSTVLEDLSELQQLRTRLEANSRLLAKLARDLGGAVLSVDTNGAVTNWSAEAEQLLGVSESRAVDSPLAAIVGEEPARALMLGLERDSTVRNRRMTWRAAGGAPRPVDVSATTLEDQSGRVTGLAIIARDAGEAERLERQMVRSEKLAAVGSLAAGLAHEIGTPLNVISATAEYLMLDQPVEGGARRELAAIVAETDRIGGLVRDLLTFSRETPAARVQVDLADVVERALTLVRIPIEKKGVRLECELAPNLPVVIADPHGLHQVLVNVLLNALDSVPAGGQIRVRAFPGRSPVRSIVLEVHDDGPGIPPQLRERVFDPFFTTRTEGTGLGLAVCARIVQLHGGDIRATDSPLGGACVALQLPASTGATTGEKESLS